MPNRKIVLSIEANKLTLGISEASTKQQHAEVTLNLFYRTISILDKCSVSTKLVIVSALAAPIATTYLLR